MTENHLHTLAHLYGVDTSYADVWGTVRHTPDESILRTLQLLDAPLAHIGEAAGAVRCRRQELWRRLLDPVLVAWDGRLPAFNVRLPEPIGGERYRGWIALEAGGSVEFEGHCQEAEVTERCQVEGRSYARRKIASGHILPYGYHRLHLVVGEQKSESLVIAAPTRAFGGAAGTEEVMVPLFSESAEEPAVKTQRMPSSVRQGLWGVFLPLYALRRKSSGMAADFSDLEALMEWTASRGGGLVATLPLLATLWEMTDDPSPYNPTSRLFWNEFYLDVGKIPGIESTPAVREQLQSLETRAAPDSGLVDYAGQLAAKRAVLETMAAEFFQHPSGRRESLALYCNEHPELKLFAQFRAVGERRAQSWPQWPEPLRSGTLSVADYDEAVFRYHLFTQWQVAEQLESMAGHARQLSLLWYLDFPLGVNGDGYDVWRDPGLFVREASGGAPPDSFFTKGQDWGFPPLRPDSLRRQGYRYFIHALRNHLRHARVLRLDHVMGLYRLFWIPHGFPATEGAYVRYPMDELCAILTLESHRFGAIIVGENLGTVPAAVDAALLRHGLDDMYVLQYETNPEKGPTLRFPPATSVASVNTHDMPPFASYWEGLDIDDRVELGLFTSEEAAKEQSRRADLRTQLIAFLRAEKLLDSETPVAVEVLEACQAYLARSSARIVLVNLEDLWGETDPQNRPGTYRERPNWRRQARYPLETFSKLPAVNLILDTVHHLRQHVLPAAEEKEFEE